MAENLQAAVEEHPTERCTTCLSPLVQETFLLKYTGRRIVGWVCPLRYDRDHPDEIVMVAGRARPHARREAERVAAGRFRDQ